MSGFAADWEEAHRARLTHETEVERIRVSDAHCPGDGVHANPDAHDWRLWKRTKAEWVVPPQGSPPITGYKEEWYCTRCRCWDDRYVWKNGETTTTRRK